MNPRQHVQSLEPCEHGGGFVYSIRDFSVNLNPYGPPAFVFDVLKASVKEIGRYPDTECTALKVQIARKFDCLDSEILVAAGVTELIQLIAIGFVKTRAVIPAHTYGEYERAVRIVGAEVKRIEMPRLEIAPEHILNDMRPGDVIFLCNPNNPTGIYLGEEDLVALIEEAERVDALLVLDEAYVDFVNNPFASHSCLHSTTNLLILRSLTKSFAIPGVRIGYALGSEPVISVLQSLKAPWSVSVFAQRVGAAVLSTAGDEFLNATRAKISRSKMRIEHELGIHSDTNFYILDVGRAASEVSARLLRNGIAVRDCTSFGLPTHIRFSVQRDDDNEILIHQLKELL